MALQEEFEKQGNVLFKYRSYFPLLLFPPAIVTIYYSFKYHPTIIKMVIWVFNDLFHNNRINNWSFDQNLYCWAYTKTLQVVIHHQVADSLNTSGIYSIVRHPLYVGNF